MSKWLRFSVTDLERKGILLVQDGNHGNDRPRPDEFVPDGVAFVRAADVNSGRVSFSSASRINEVARSRIRKGVGQPGDVLLSHKGTVGRVAMVPMNAPEFVCSPQTTFWRSLDDSSLDRIYLHCFMRSADFVAQLDSRKGETDMAPYVSLTEQRKLTVVLPPILEQRAIAGVLGALDDKIKSNRQKAELIDAILLFEYQLLLKRDDAKTVPLGTLVKPALGGVWGSDNATEKEQLKVSCFRGVDLASIARTEWPKPPTRWISEGLFAPRKFGSGEIWLEGSGSFCGRSLLISESIQQLFDEPVCYSNFVKRVVPISDPRLSVVSWLALRHAYNIGEVAQSRIGSAFPNLDLGALLSNTQVLLPNDSDLNKLCQLAESRLDTQVLRENRTLSELRDTLLPELLSGRLRVKDAASIMETV